MTTAAKLCLVSQALVLALTAADVANMTGVWKLNLEKSNFQTEAAPLSVQLRIEHTEPALKYSGTVQRNQESSPDTFEFQGAIDEKIYPVKQSTDTGERSSLPGSRRELSSHGHRITRWKSMP